MLTHLASTEERKPPVQLAQHVKTEAVSIYRNLTASSRREELERAIEVGSIESSIFAPRAISYRKDDAQANLNELNRRRR